MGVLVDSNVLLDLVTEGTPWFEWSSHRVAFHAEYDDLIINPLIYAEVSIPFSSFEELERKFPPSNFKRENLPWEASFLAGRCYVEYKRRGGTRRSPMPDFYIGAHASISGYSLLTRDAARYRTYFPQLNIISPGDAS